MTISKRFAVMAEVPLRQLHNYNNLKIITVEDGCITSKSPGREN